MCITVVTAVYTVQYILCYMLLSRSPPNGCQDARLASSGLSEPLTISCHVGTTQYYSHYNRTSGPESGSSSACGMCAFYAYSTCRPASGMWPCHMHSMHTVHQAGAHVCMGTYPWQCCTALAVLYCLGSVILPCIGLV